MEKPFDGLPKSIPAKLPRVEKASAPAIKIKSKPAKGFMKGNKPAPMLGVYKKKM